MDLLLNPHHSCSKGLAHMQEDPLWRTDTHSTLLALMTLVHILFCSVFSLYCGKRNLVLSVEIMCCFLHFLNLYNLLHGVFWPTLSIVMWLWQRSNQAHAIIQSGPVPVRLQYILFPICTPSLGAPSATDRLQHSTIEQYITDTDRLIDSNLDQFEL